jgi:hypothetical protein
MADAYNEKNASHLTTGVTEMASKLIEQLASKGPVAAMFRSIFERVLSEESLNKIFLEHAKIQMECDILFSHLVLKQANACLSGRDFGSAAATEPAGLADFFQLL